MSSKYNMLYPPLVERVFAEERGKYKKSTDAEKAAKTRLHQMYGAYVQGNAHKKASSLLDDLEKSFSDVPLDIRGVSEKIMGLHASTRERLPHLQLFWDFIAAHTGKIGTVMDLGCGLNPFSVPYMAEMPQAYYAYDIDTRTRDILNRFFSCLGLPQTAACADLAVETPKDTVDLALVCKLLPVLEMQASGRGFQLAREIDARFLVVTYPLKSLGGREKGMGKNYSAAFENAVAKGAFKTERGGFEPIAQEIIGNELVYVLAITV